MQTLRKARESKGVTKKAMANHLGISRPTNDTYEEHPERMRVEDAKAAAEFLGYAVEDIFFAAKCN